MNHKIKIELDASVVMVYCWKKGWWIFGQWEPIYNSSHSNAYDSYCEYERLCKGINPFFKPNK